MTQDLLARVRAFADRELSNEELDAWTSAPVTDDEREEFLSLVRWFTRRYPTPAERFAYVRRAMARWRPAPPSGRPPSPA